MFNLLNWLETVSSEGFSLEPQDIFQNHIDWSMNIEIHILDLLDDVLAWVDANGRSDRVSFSDCSQPSLKPL